MQKRLVSKRSIFLTTIPFCKRLVKCSEKIYLKDILDEEDIKNYGLNTDIGVRECAFAYINGEVFTGDKHSSLLNRYNSEYGMFPEEVAFGSYLIGKDGTGYAVIYPETLENANINVVAEAVKYEFNGAVVCTSNERYTYDFNNDSSDENYLNVIAKNKLKKIAQRIYLTDILSEDSIDIYGVNTDYGNRDLAIAYIDGEIFEGDVHKDIVSDYINNNDLDVELNFEEGFVTEDEQDDLGERTAFASLINGKDGNVYIAIYPDSVFFVSMDEVVSALKSKYPGAIICVDNNDRYSHYDAEDEIYIESI